MDSSTVVKSLISHYQSHWIRNFRFFFPYFVFFPLLGKFERHCPLVIRIFQCFSSHNPEKFRQKTLEWEWWRLRRSFMNLTEWCERRVKCQQLIGDIKHTWKKYDACKLIGGQILCSGWCTPLQGHVYPYFQKIPSLTNSFLQKSLSKACLCTVNNFLTLYSSNLTKILFLQRNFSKDNFKNIWKRMMAVLQKPLFDSVALSA